MTEIGALKSKVIGDHGRWDKLVLSGKHTQQWMQVRAALLWSQPAFADVFLSMMVDHDKELGWFTDKISVAATDDKFLYLNPNTFFENYTLYEQVFIVCHEISHCIFNHCGMLYLLGRKKEIVYPDGVTLPFENEIMQVAMDCLINDLLINSKVGSPPWRQNKQTGTMEGLCHQPQLITYNDDMLGAYRKLYKKLPPELGRSFDEHLEPGTGEGKPPQEAQEERNQQAWDNALNAALKSARAQGRLPAALDRGLSKLLEPKVDWRDHLMFTIQSKIGRDRQTWNHSDNELMVQGIGAPGRLSNGCELVVFVKDTSGSISNDLDTRFSSELAGIIEEIHPRHMILMQCDADIAECVEIEETEDLLRKIKGGGGTDFRPPFKWLQDEGLEPDCLIYLTDLFGTFPSIPPSYPVIWATITDTNIPWGEKVLIPLS